jgi:hypothetical protein
MAKITDPFSPASPYAQPPRPTPVIPMPPPQFRPGQTSPLEQNARNAAALRAKIELAQEQRRAEQIPAAITSGRAAPRFGDKPAPAPFPTSGDRYAQPSVPPTRIRDDGAGGSPEGAPSKVK